MRAERQRVNEERRRSGNNGDSAYLGSQYECTTRMRMRVEGREGDIYHNRVMISLDSSSHSGEAR